jgi:hypothetical protein
MADDVQLPDLEVIARYSLAVRAATAPREDVIAALEADLAWLTAGHPSHRRPAATAAAPASPPPAAPRRRRAPRPATSE